jgi:hypothetical protein
MPNTAENLLPQNHQSNDAGRDTADILVYSGTLTATSTPLALPIVEIGAYRDFTLFVKGTTASETPALTIAYQLSSDGITWWDPLKEADATAASPIISAKAVVSAGFAWAIPLSVKAQYIRFTASLDDGSPGLATFIVRLFAGV